MASLSQEEVGAWWNLGATRIESPRVLDAPPRGNVSAVSAIRREAHLADPGLTALVIKLVLRQQDAELAGTATLLEDPGHPSTVREKFHRREREATPRGRGGPGCPVDEPVRVRSQVDVPEQGALGLRLPTPADQCRAVERFGVGVGEEQDVAERLDRKRVDRRHLGRGKARREREILLLAEGQNSKCAQPRRGAG